MIGVESSKQTISYQHHILNPKVSIIIPTLNEERNLPHVLPHIPAWVHEVILIDGRSSDRTVAVARELMPEIRVVLEPGKGKGLALRAGFAAAEGDIIVMLDADGSMNPNEIGSFVRLLRDGADFVKGSRFLQGAGTSDMEFYRRWGNSLLTIMVNVLYGSQYTDLCYGYCAFWKRALPFLALDATGFEIETLMNIRALKARLKVYEVASFEDKRIYGESNLNTIKDGWRILRVILRERVLNRAYIPVQYFHHD